MKKAMLLILTGALCFGALAACTDAPEQPETSAEQTTEAPENTTELPTEQESTQQTTEQTTEEVTEVITYDPATLSEQTYQVSDTAHVKQIGRLVPLSDGLACDHVMSGFEIEGIMYGKVTLTVGCDRDTYFTVYVDGVRSEERLYAPAGAADLVLADFETAQVHHIRLLKQTEPQFSLCTLKTITLTGELQNAPADRRFYIEVLGDSITSGYGILGQPSSENPGDAIWHDGTKTYAALSIYALDADCSVISCSGIGANKGFPFFDMQQYYRKPSFFRDMNAPDYVPERTPDVVIINLGTNDFSQGATEQGFKDSVKSLITYIRTLYGKDVPIVWVYGMMGDCRFEWTEPVLAELGGEAAGIFTVRMSANHNGTNGHPNLSGHRNASRRLTEVLEDILLGE